MKFEDISCFIHFQRFHQIFQVVKEMSGNEEPEVLCNLWGFFFFFKLLDSEKVIGTHLVLLRFHEIPWCNYFS